PARSGGSGQAREQEQLRNTARLRFQRAGTDLVLAGLAVTPASGGDDRAEIVWQLHWGDSLDDKPGADANARLRWTTATLLDSSGAAGPGLSITSGALDIDFFAQPCILALPPG